MNGSSYFHFGVALVALALAFPASVAQTTAPSTTSSVAAESRKGDWSEIDQRLLFFTTQLASVEASIDAVSKQLRIAGYQQTVKEAQAEQYRRGSEMMDRNMGMPTSIRWESFYGRTAEKFFYHPVDSHTHYLNLTLQGDNRSKEIAAAPAPQRPPQIDYIYRANADAQRQAEAEAAKLAGKQDALLSRRRELETEQAELWTKIAFRAVAGRELSLKALYRFEPTISDPDPVSLQRIQAVRSAVVFFCLTGQIDEQTDKPSDADLPAVIRRLQETVTVARKQLSDTLAIQTSLSTDLADKTSELGKFVTVAKKMEDVAKNISDAYQLAQDGDRANDDQRKNTFRSLLQESLITYAEAILASDECITNIAREWKITSDVGKPIVLPVITTSTAPVDNSKLSARSDNTLRMNPTDTASREAVGEWDVRVRSSKLDYHMPMKLAADGSATISEPPIKGQWSIVRGQLIVQWDNRTQHTYTLEPDGRIAGKDSNGDNLSASRPTK